jgi:Replication-relaxation
MELLFFPSSRSAQIRLKQLKDFGLLQRWKVIEPPGITRRPPVFLLSRRGARVLAASRSEDPTSLVRLAPMAELHCPNVTHALEANGFSVDLAVASRELPDRGLYHWVGEAAMRTPFRNWKRRSRLAESAPTSDGWGRFLTPSGEVVFELERHRGNESLQPLERKIRSYIGYFKNRRNAELHHLHFVLPNLVRERAVLGRIDQELPTFALSCRHFWLTNRPLLEREGPMARIWLYAGPSKEPMNDRGHKWRPPAIGRRLDLDELPAMRRQPRDRLACVESES